MALPTFDYTKHSIGLGDEVENILGFMVSPGSYRRGIQERSSQLITIGNRLLQDGKVSQWSQFDFSGGAYQEYFDDEKMFHWSGQLSPSYRGRKALRVTQALAQCFDDVGLISVDRYPGLFSVADVCTVGSTLLIACSDGEVYKLVPDFETAEGRFLSTAVDLSDALSCIGYNPVTDKVIVGHADGQVEELNFTNLTHFRAWKWDNAAKTHAYMPSGWTRSCNRVTTYGGYVVVGMGDHIFYYSATDVTTTEDGDGHCTSCTWTYIGATLGRVRAFCEHQGLLLALTCLNDFDTYIYSSTLTANFALWMKVPYVFSGNALSSYAGRVFVGGSGYSGNLFSTCAELYEIDGSSFREIHSYQDPNPREGYPGFTFSGIRNFSVWEGGLYFPNTSRYSIECYDFIGDALFTTFHIDSVAEDTFPLPLLVVATEGTLLVLTTPDGGLYYVQSTHGLADELPVLEASEYKVEPLLLKKWITAQVYSYNSGWTVETSSDGGEWAPAPSAGAEVIGGNRVETFDLSSIVPSHGLRVRVTLDPDSAASDSPCLHELQGIALGFILVPPHLRAWNMSLQAVKNSELLDGGMDVTTVSDEVVNQLWEWFDNVDTLFLVDRDGVTHTVLITSIQETEPQMVGDTSREVFVSVTLSELG